MKVEIPFCNISGDFFAFAASTNPVILRGALEVFDKNTQSKRISNVVITIKGRTMNIKPGALKKGGKGEPSVTKEITYIKIVIDNAVQLELDKLNSIFIMGGVDLYADIRNAI